jgi:uncharacterized RDD family membrane protein YckC
MPMSRARADDYWWQYRLIPAGFPLRTVAYVVDTALAVALIGGFYWFFRGFDETAQRYLDPELRNTLPPGIFMQSVEKILGLAFLFNVFYGVVCEASPWSGTIGKRLVGIRVVDEYGERLSLTTSAIRNLVKIVSLAVLGLGCLATLWHPGGRAWHDRLAGTFVARG